MSEIIDGQVVSICPRCHGSGSDGGEKCGLCDGTGEVAMGGLTAESKDIPDNEAYRIDWL